MKRAGADIAVIIPVLNRAAYLREALGSVLRQSLPAAEIIVIDDGSTDGTPDVIAEFGGRVRCLRRQEPRGAGSARNDGAAVAGSGYVAFLDSDDLWTDDALERLFEPVGRDGAVWTAGRVRQFICPDLPAQEAGRIRCPPGDAFARTAGSMLFHRQVFLDAGGFNPDFRAGEFMDLAARLEEAGLTAFAVDRRVVNRRLHASNMMRQGRTLQMEYLRVLAAKRARERERETQALHRSADP